MTEEQKENRNSRRREYYARHKKNQDGFTVHNRQRFEIVPQDLDRLDIARNGETIKRFENKEIAGMKWKDFEELLPTVGIKSGKYHYSLKMQNKPEIITGIVKSVDKNKMEDSKEITKIERTIDELKKVFLSKPSNDNSPTMEFMLSAVKQTHQTEIELYKLQISIKDGIILELRGTIKELETELDKAELEVQRLIGEGGTGKTADAILGIFNRFVPQAQQSKIKLSEKFDGSDIPEDIISTLAVVDYKNIPENKLNGLKQGLTMIVNQLPKKVA